MSVIQGIYIALFGRPADPAGLAYWDGVTKGGTDLAEMLRVLPSLNEYTSRFAGQTPDQVITTIFQSLFGRAPDAAGLEFFKAQLASGAQNMATIAINILQGAQGADKADIDAKVNAAVLFTAALDTPAEIAAYSGSAAANAARAFLNNVDKDKPATADDINKAVNDVQQGQAPVDQPGGGGAGTGGGGDAPMTLLLKQSADRLVGGTDADTFIASEAHSLSSGDILRGSGGTDVLKIGRGALGPETRVIPDMAGIEIIQNSNINSQLDLIKSFGVERVETDFTGATGTPSQFYLGSSTATSFIAKGNTSGEATLSLRFRDLTPDSTINLGLEGNQGYQAFYFGSGVKVGTVALDLAAGSAGQVSVRNVADNVVLTGEGGVTYITHGTAVHNFDASAVKGAVKLQYDGEGHPAISQINITSNSTILTGAGNDTLFLGKSTGNLKINAGAGDDTIYSGLGSDTFVFTGANFGNDTIRGFQVATDKIDLSAYDLAMIAVTTTGGNAVVTVGGAGSITVVGVSEADLGSALVLA